MAVLLYVPPAIYDCLFPPAIYNFLLQAIHTNYGCLLKIHLDDHDCLLQVPPANCVHTPGAPPTQDCVLIW